jgi:hypothetical protein
MPIISGQALPTQPGFTTLSVAQESYLGGTAGQSDAALNLSTVAGQPLLQAFGADTGAVVMTITEHGATLARGDTGLAATDPVFQVQDETGALIFQVRNDGSLHGKTGKTLTFDL